MNMTAYKETRSKHVQGQTILDWIFLNLGPGSNQNCNTALIFYSDNETKTIIREKKKL
jgi:hypothetical protein